MLRLDHKSHRKRSIIIKGSLAGKPDHNSRGIDCDVELKNFIKIIEWAASRENLLLYPLDPKLQVFISSPRSKSSVSVFAKKSRYNSRQFWHCLPPITKLLWTLRSDTSTFNLARGPIIIKAYEAFGTIGQFNGLCAGFAARYDKGPSISPDSCWIHFLVFTHKAITVQNVGPAFASNERMSSR